MYAQMWEEDRLIKSKREEMEAALQIERNREALKVEHLLLHYTYYCSRPVHWFELPTRDLLMNVQCHVYVYMCVRVFRC